MPNQTLKIFVSCCGNPTPTLDLYTCSAINIVIKFLPFIVYFQFERYKGEKYVMISFTPFISETQCGGHEQPNSPLKAVPKNYYQLWQTTADELPTLHRPDIVHG